jgi:hypothetical protein
MTGCGDFPVEVLHVEHLWNLFGDTVGLILLGIGIVLGVPLLIFYFRSRRRKEKRKAKSKKE